MSNSPCTPATSQGLSALETHRAALCAELAAGNPWFELHPQLREFGLELLQAPGQSELAELLTYSEPSLSLTLKILVRPVQDRLQVEAYMTAGPRTGAKVKSEMPPDYFELLSVAGFSVLSQSPEEFAAYARLSPAAAIDCCRLHQLVGELIKLEIGNCEASTRACFSMVERVLPSASSPENEFLPMDFAREIGARTGGSDAHH